MKNDHIQDEIDRQKERQEFLEKEAVEVTSHVYGKGRLSGLEFGAVQIKLLDQEILKLEETVKFATEKLQIALDGLNSIVNYGKGNGGACVVQPSHLRAVAQRTLEAIII